MSYTPSDYEFLSNVDLLNDYDQSLAWTPQPSPMDASEPSSFVCRWEGCCYTGAFRRKADLLRHLETIHISPQSFACLARGCHRMFNRRDNMRQHLFRRHENADQIWARFCATL
ncbi:hypothetical protein FE257_012749 [Aspergillus nanangensis]|uniref:C2H2-type domain-containing protein n=1 Tax=Aspergillus nanangensis TaxID=2582783 RepID=A0AAD4CGV0_ASPNN|nr:hypothetical protein FE257_012749 [Aspergillus nanangensis]